MIQGETGQGRFWRQTCLVAAAALGLSLGLAYIRHAEPEPAAVPQSRFAGPAPSVFQTVDPTDAVSPAEANDPRLVLTENRELVVNSELRELIDSFLLEKTDDDRADQLKVYLKSRLPLRAYDEAMQILKRYQAYMKAHDDLLSAQHLNVSVGSNIDIGRIEVWRQQREQLRQRILGAPLALALYQNDDAQLDQAIAEWRQRVEDAQSTMSSASAPRYPVPHWRNKTDEDRHRQYLLGVLEKAVTSYETLGRERKQRS
jgi:hypothetical protein